MRAIPIRKLRVGAVFLYKLIDTDPDEKNPGCGLWPWKRVAKPKHERMGCIWAVPIGVPPWIGSHQAQSLGEPCPFLPDQIAIV